MPSHPRPVPRPRPPLRLGDHVRVTYAGGSGPCAWTGTVTGIDASRWLARISDGTRVAHAALRGAAYVQVLIPAAEMLPDHPLAGEPAAGSQDVGFVPDDWALVDA